MNQERSIANVFLDDPNGVRVHFQLVEGTPAEELRALVANVDTLISAQLAKGYSAATMQERGRRPSAPRDDVPFEEDTDNPKCPDCGGPTEHKTGTAKNGRAWAGYFCLKTKDADKNHKHTPVWI